MPLMLLDAHSIETNEFKCVAKIDANESYYLPIELLYSTSTSRLFFSVQQ
jgi:hypothetical protein